MPPYSLRPATEADTDVLFRIHRASMTDYLVEALGAWPEDVAREHHLAWMREGRAQAVVVVQGRGIGRAILIELLTQAQQRGLPARLEVFAHNPARRLYESLDFCETGREGPSIEMQWHPDRVTATA